MSERQVAYVVARADDGTIGQDNAVPWVIKEDRKRYIAHTKGKPMIMGRKTFESLPGLLKGCRHIVLTRDPNWCAEGAEVVGTPEEALRVAGEGDVTVIGGVAIFDAFLPHATGLEMTEIHEHTGGDVRMPPPGPEWREVSREFRVGGGGDPAHSFVSFERAD